MSQKKPAKPKFVYDVQRMAAASAIAQKVFEGLAYLNGAPLEELEYFVWACNEAGKEAKEKDPFGVAAEMDLNGHWENTHIMEAFVRFRRDTADDVAELVKIHEAGRLRAALLEGVPRV